MKNNDDIPSTDTNEIKHLINRVKQGELDQDEALLIEKLLNIRVLAVTGRRIWFLLTFTALPQEHLRSGHPHQQAANWVLTIK